jgi:outer membrane protein
MKTVVVTALVVLIAAQALVLAEGPKIGLFDPGRVSEETEEGKMIAARLTALNDKKVGEIQAKEKQIADLQSQLSSQGLSLSQERRGALEKDIQRAALDLNQSREAARNELQIEVAEAQNRFQAKLLQVVEQFGREDGFDLILVKEPALVPYHNIALDVTTAIVDRFNKAFPAAPEAPPQGAAPAPKKD